MKMRLKDGKLKVLTLSYDDGVVQDIRLIEILDKYGLKGTYNINSGKYLKEDVQRERFYGRMKLSEAQSLYNGSQHEVALHTLTHPDLRNLTPCEIIYEVNEDRRNIENQYGIIARGMAYPHATYNEKVLDVLGKCNIAYARTAEATYKFSFPDNWLTLHPTCHHKCEELMDLAEKFVENTPMGNKAQMFYLWGHSYEFDKDDNWDVIERFCEYVGGHDDIWYATNIEIYDYVTAYNRLQTSYDKKIIHNPSAIDVWIDIDDEVYCIKGGATLTL